MATLGYGDLRANGADVLQWYTRTFTATAPTREQTYNFQWSLFQRDVGGFGEMSPAVAIRVGKPA